MYVNSDHIYDTSLANDQTWNGIQLHITTFSISSSGLIDVLDQESDIQSYVTQLSTCFKLLIPSQDVFDVFDDTLFTDKSVSTSTTGNVHIRLVLS